MFKEILLWNKALVLSKEKLWGFILFGGVNEKARKLFSTQKVLYRNISFCFGFLLHQFLENVWNLLCFTELTNAFCSTHRAAMHRGELGYHSENVNMKWWEICWESHPEAKYIHKVIPQWAWHCAFYECSVHQLAINFSYDEESKICRFMQAAIKQSQLAANAGQVSIIYLVF
jgi:hypothetical protein